MTEKGALISDEQQLQQLMTGPNPGNFNVLTSDFEDYIFLNIKKFGGLMVSKNIFSAQIEQQRLDSLKAQEASLESKKNESLKVKVMTL